MKSGSGALASNMSSENEQFIQHELESGMYQSRGVLLDEAVGFPQAAPGPPA